MAHALHRHQPQRRRADPTHWARRLGRPHPLERNTRQTRSWRPTRRWYELLDPTRWRDQSWRDPWLFVDPIDGDFRVLITARSRQALQTAPASSAHARSPDLVHWEVLPPLTPPGDFAPGRVPQLVRLDGSLPDPLLVSRARTTPRHGGNGSAAHGVTGTLRLFRDRRSTVPIRRATTPIAGTDGLGPLYAGKLVESGAHRAGRSWPSAAPETVTSSAS